MAVATKYMKLAGYPSGKYTGGKTLQVVGATGEPEEGMAQIVNQALQSLGFKTHLSLVDKSVMYEKYCTRALAGRSTSAPTPGGCATSPIRRRCCTCPFYGPAISPSGNPNWGQVNDPQINAAMEKATLVVGEPARAEAWAKIDEILVRAGGRRAGGVRRRRPNRGQGRRRASTSCGTPARGTTTSPR